MDITKGGLAIILSKLKSFERHGDSNLKQKVRDEQYSTDAEIASEILWEACLRGDIAGKVIADLGCGTGILGIGACLLGAKEVCFVDNDPLALSVARENLKSVGNICMKGSKICLNTEPSVYFFEEDVRKFRKMADIALLNPPFGTKVRHADVEFLKVACKIAPVIYSLHKSVTSGYIIGFYQKEGFRISAIKEFSFPIRASSKYHRQRIYRFKVCCIRAERLKK